MGKSAVVRALDYSVRAASVIREQSHASTVRYVFTLVFDALLVGVSELGLGFDVDLPAGQPRGESGVLTITTDRQRELVVRHDDRGLLGLVVDEHLTHSRRRERFGDESRRLIVERDDVDLLSTQLRDDHPDSRSPGADTGPHRIDSVAVRDDRDLRPPARLAGDIGDLHQVVGDFGHLELEQLLDQL